MKSLELSRQTERLVFVSLGRNYSFFRYHYDTCRSSVGTVVLFMVVMPLL